MSSETPAQPTSLVPPTPLPAEAVESAEYPMGSPYTLAQWRATARCVGLTTQLRPQSWVTITYLICCAIIFALPLSSHRGMPPILSLLVALLLIIGLQVVMVFPLPIRAISTAIFQFISGGVILLLAAVGYEIWGSAIGYAHLAMGVGYDIYSITTGVAILNAAPQIRQMTHLPPELQTQMRDLLRRIRRLDASVVMHLISIKARLRGAFWSIEWSALLLKDSVLLVSAKGYVAYFLRREEFVMEVTDTGAFTLTLPAQQLTGTIKTGDLRRYREWLSAGPALGPPPVV